MNQIIEMNIEIDKVLRNSFLSLTRRRLQILEDQAEKEPRPNPGSKARPENTAN